jgi:hypothetical protein
MPIWRNARPGKRNILQLTTEIGACWLSGRWHGVCQGIGWQYHAHHKH